MKHLYVSVKNKQNKKKTAYINDSLDFSLALVLVTVFIHLKCFKFQLGNLNPANKDFSCTRTL